MAVVLPTFTGKQFKITKTPATPQVIAFDPKQDYLQLEGNSADYVAKAITGGVEIRTKENNQLVATVNGLDLAKFVRRTTVNGVQTNTNVEDLPLFGGNNPDGQFYVVSTQNNYFTTNLKPYFQADPYLALPTNSDVAGLIASGKYTDAYDHYLRSGQFEPQREDTFLAAGTKGTNDTITGIADETLLIGVTIDKAVYSGGADISATSFGVGEKDTLIGTPGENLFILGSGTRFGGEPKMFYVGGGIEDYARIKNFGVENDIIDVPGVYTDYVGKNAKYKLEVVGGDTKLSTKSGDLIAMIEGVNDLVPFSGGRNDTGIAQLRSLQSRAFVTPQATFNEKFYLDRNPGVKQLIDNGVYASGYDYFIKTGEFKTDSSFTLFNGALDATGKGVANSVTGFGAKSILTGVAITDAVFVNGGFDLKADAKDLGQAALGTLPTTGANAGKLIDTLSGENIFVIGTGNLLNANAKSFYVGGGDNDYAQINRFDKQKDAIMAAGTAADWLGNNAKYKIEVVDRIITLDPLTQAPKTVKDSRISTIGGDLIAIVAEVDNLTVLSGKNGTVNLVSKERPGVTDTIKGNTETIKGDGTTTTIKDGKVTTKGTVGKLIFSAADQSGVVTLKSDMLDRVVKGDAPGKKLGYSQEQCKSINEQLAKAMNSFSAGDSRRHNDPENIGQIFAAVGIGNDKKLGGIEPMFAENSPLSAPVNPFGTQHTFPR
jgi:hypothetical protein